jgi:hypothetical protein
MPSPPMDESTSAKGPPDPSPSRLADESSGSSPGPKRRLIQALEIEHDIAQQMIEALQELRTCQQIIITELANGATASRLMTPDNLARRDHVRALLALCTSAVQRSRAEAIRELIDVEGLSLQLAARVAGHPRQLIKRLYNKAKEAP